MCEEEIPIDSKRLRNKKTQRLRNRKTKKQGDKKDRGTERMRKKRSTERVYKTLIIYK
jgi:hypothetical protein